MPSDSVRRAVFRLKRIGGTKARAWDRWLGVDAKGNYFDVRFRDTQGRPPRQAVWTYAEHKPLEAAQRAEWQGDWRALAACELAMADDLVGRIRSGELVALNAPAGLDAKRIVAGDVPPDCRIGTPALLPTAQRKAGSTAPDTSQKKGENAQRSATGGRTAYNDSRFFPGIQARLEQNVSKKAAFLEFAEKAEGGGTLSARAKRLERGFNKDHPETLSRHRRARAGENGS